MGQLFTASHAAAVIDVLVRCWKYISAQYLMLLTLRAVLLIMTGKSKWQCFTLENAANVKAKSAVLVR